MANSNTAGCHSERLIDEIETTSDRLTGRAGLVLFSRYLRGIGIFPHLNRLFGSLRRSRKGLAVVEIFHQLFCFFLDGTSRHLTYFDALKEDPNHPFLPGFEDATLIETRCQPAPVCLLAGSLHSSLSILDPVGS